MGIAFSFKNNIQYVKLDGTLAAVEEAAIRLKLDQKINQGRAKILIDIGGFNVNDKESVHGLRTILKYATQRGTFLAVYGLKQTQWILVAEGFPQKLNLFETEGEAIKWVDAAAAAAEAAAAAAKSPDAEKPDEKKDPEAEIKERKVKELLAKYEIYQAQNDYDPYLLRKLEKEYSATLTREPLFALRRAYKNVFTLKDSLDAIEKHCRDLADQLLESTKIRKIPLSPTELSLKKKAIQDTRAAVDAEVGEIKEQIAQHMGQAGEYRKKMAAADEKWKLELAGLKSQIDQQTQDYKKLLAQLQSAGSAT